MVKKCKHAAGCTKQPAFDVAGGKGRFCVEHKAEGMADVRNKRCEAAGCTKRPTFDVAGGKGKFCVEHKLEGMADVRSKRCEAAGCTKRPTFDVAGGKGRFCVEHKLEGMEDVKHKRCEAAGCTKLNPTFDVAGGKGRFCVEHKLEGMQDVKNKRCEAAGCTTSASYGIPAKQVTACAQHKAVGMIVQPRKTCSHARCNNTGTHEHDGKRLCETHAPPDATNLALARCSSCGLLDVLTRGLCPTCNPEAVARATHAKELQVKALLDLNGLTYVSHDRVVDGGACERYRPDFVFDAGTHMVVLEVDENQHKSYACLCEQQRMVNLSQAFGLPTLFLRYNPDGFTGPTARPARLSESARTKVLTDWVKWSLTPEYSPTAMGAYCTAVYLCYDGFTAAGAQERVKLL